MNRRLHGVAREAVEVRRGRREAPVLAGLPPPHPEEVETSHWKQGLRFLATGARANRRSDPGRYGTVLTKSDRAKPRLFDCRAPRAKLWPSVRRGASPGDGVFVPVSPVSLLIRPNRMTVSPGPRAGRRPCPSGAADEKGQQLRTTTLGQGESGIENRRPDHHVPASPAGTPEATYCPNGPLPAKPRRTLRLGFISPLEREAVAR